MPLKFMKENLPWIAPSAAIVLAASGYFDRYTGGSEPAGAQPATVSAAVAPAPQAASLSSLTTQVAAATAPVQEAAAPAEMDAVTRLSLVTDAALQAIEAPVDAPLPTEQVRAPEPKPEPAATELAYNSTKDAATFFTQAQARLAAQESCKSDLRALASQARVYFPAGGLNVDEAGIEQARLIGMLAQNCTGVQIVVEGHSDPSGNPAVNLKLSQKRAEQVIQRISAMGIDTTMFVAQGLGDKVPSGRTGPQGDAFYDRRVEFTVIETGTSTAFNGATTRSWSPTSCVAKLQNAVSDLNVFYAPRSIAVQGAELDAVVAVARIAQSCPEARLRVIGQHADTRVTGETVGTGILRAKALMTMLVAQGIDAGEVIIAAPSRPREVAGLSGSRVDFDVITE